MAEPIDVIGIGADGPAGLRRQVIERIEAAEVLVGGERHLSYFPSARGRRHVIKNDIPELLRLISSVFPRPCVVLASGDPLFYGIGRLLLGVLGREYVRVEPALSSMQLAFARFGYSWQDAELSSVHGRVLRPFLLPLLGEELIGLFTNDGSSPAEIAQFFIRYGLNGYSAHVGENLGGQDERLTNWSDLNELSKQSFDPLNYLILVRTEYPSPWDELRRLRALVPGVPDEAFCRPERLEVMTRQEIRSVVLARLLQRTAEGDTIWDIGAGLGTVAVEIAVLRPSVEVVAVERSAERIVYLRRNRERFDANNIRVVEGMAPEVLEAEVERPCAVFIGGSGNHLSNLLPFVAERLRDGGRLVANFVTLEHLMLTVDRLKAWGWPYEITEVHVSRSDSLAGLTGLKPQRGVFIVSADKRGPSNA